MKENPDDIPTDEYSIEDDNPPRRTPDPNDESPLNDSYSLEEDDEDDCVYGNEGEEDQNAGQTEEQPKKLPSHKKAWRRMLYLLFNPIEGWKKIRRADMNAEDVARECFYPLTAIAAVSCYLECLWNSNVGLKQATVDAVNVFVAFFFGNFLVLMLIKLLYPKEEKRIADTDFGKQYVMYNLSTLALFYILYRCFQMIGPVLVFLPIWTIYLALRGTRFFKLPQENSNLLKTLMCIFIIAAPIAVYWVMDFII